MNSKLTFILPIFIFLNCATTTFNKAYPTISEIEMISNSLSSVFNNTSCKDIKIKSIDKHIQKNIQATTFYVTFDSDSVYSKNELEFAILSSEYKLEIVYRNSSLNSSTIFDTLSDSTISDKLNKKADSILTYFELYNKRFKKNEVILKSTDYYQIEYLPVIKKGGKGLSRIVDSRFMIFDTNLCFVSF